MQSSTKVRNKRAFSLIELVIVVVIIGIIGAIAIPRMSRGSRGAAESSLKGNLAILRGAVEMFAAEHDGVYPTDATSITAQLTSKTNAAGTVDAAGLYGPYLQAIPPLPVGANKGGVGFAAVYAADPTVGWVYDATAHTIKANTNPAGADPSEEDAEGVKYSDY
jgi:prepilin-type N-terminal cleavage/methylation domain-containing protein